ncbi:hypothetical protein H6F88_05315 [Oculatella sp. FACHB-28]|nr:hypothetical protein [Oculatella sp. FACHB-28]MBD2055443.1 hypothetical protein [Oculatella sp. FACHB-28]
MEPMRLQAQAKELENVSPDSDRSESSAESFWLVTLLEHKYSRFCLMVDS